MVAPSCVDTMGRSRRATLVVNDLQIGVKTLSKIISYFFLLIPGSSLVPSCPFPAFALPEVASCLTGQPTGTNPTRLFSCLLIFDPVQV